MPRCTNPRWRWVLATIWQGWGVAVGVIILLNVSLWAPLASANPWGKNVNPSDPESLFEPPGRIPIPDTPPGAIPWATLEKTTIDYDPQQGQIKPGWHPAVKALEGKKVRLIGFMIPIKSGTLHKEILFTKMPPTCPFCPPADPNQQAIVQLAKPLPFTDAPLVLEGTLELLESQEAMDLGLFYRLALARVVRLP